MSSLTQTLTNGIQEVSAILPLLGTEQCEEHVGQALDNGFLYAAITPISLFGSLGIVKAGFNALLAGIVIKRFRFFGAKMLDYTAFHPKGGIAELIAIDKEHRGRFLVESRIEKLLEEEHIGDTELVAHPSGVFKWNLFMALSTLIIPLVLGITPYLFIVFRSSSSHASFGGSPAFAFPIIRIICNVLCVVTIQIIYQHRILTIVRMRLIFIYVDRFAKYNGYSISEHIHAWNKDTSSELCIWALREHLDLWANQERATPYIEMTSGAFTPRNSPDGKLRDIIDEFLREVHGWQFCDVYSAFTTTQGVLLQILLFVTLFTSIVGSVLGYIGCFNAVADATNGNGESTAPIIWLGLEGVLCFVRILIWGFNPVWDDNLGITFSQMSHKNNRSLATCDLDGEEIEKLGVAPVVREGEFLREVAFYSGLVTSFDHKSTEFYYILTRRRKEEAKKRLYVIVSNFKEQTSRLLVRDDSGDSFRMYVSRLVQDKDSDSTSLSVHFQVNDNSKLPEETEMKEAFDPDFMPRFKQHYNEILDSMESKHTWVQFRSRWTLGQIERRFFVKNGEREEVAMRADSLSADEEYITFGQKQRQAMHILDGLEKWIQIYSEALHKGLQLSLRLGSRMKSRTLGFGSNILLMTQVYEDHEVEFLLHEAKLLLELMLLKQLSRLGRRRAKDHIAMRSTVLNSFKTNYAFDSDPEYWTEKLRSRLSNEWKLCQKRLIELPLSRAVHRLEEHSNPIRDRVLMQTYDRTVNTNMLDRWRTYAEFTLIQLEIRDDDVLTEETQDGSDNSQHLGVGRESGHYVEHVVADEVNSHLLEREHEDYQKYLSSRFKTRWPIFCAEIDAENGFNTEGRLFFYRLFNQLEYKYLAKAQTLFDMLDGQLTHLEYLVLQQSTEFQYQKMRPEEQREMQEMLLFIQNHRFLKITRTSLDVFGGLVKICEVLKKIRGMSVIDFNFGLFDFTAEDIKAIKSLIQEVKTITGVLVSKYSEHPEISQAIKANVDKMSKTDDVCFYEFVRVADISGVPYLYFNKPGDSVCVTKFSVKSKEDHLLTLRHCFKGCWEDNGEIEVTLNGTKLPQIWGLAPTLEDFGDEDIILPQDALRIDGKNELEIRLKGGVYHLADVFLPALPYNYPFDEQGN